MAQQRNLEDIHRDVDFANRYRLVCIKHLMSVTAGIFVISIAFIKDIIGPGKTEYTNLVLIGWLSLSLSMTAGIFHMKCWDRFYISYRKKWDEGERRRKRINLWHILSEAFQVIFFIVGVLAILLFATLNLK